jgi:hypothetical protein
MENDIAAFHDLRVQIDSVERRPREFQLIAIVRSYERCQRRVGALRPKQAAHPRAPVQQSLDEALPKKACRTRN